MTTDVEKPQAKSLEKVGKSRWYHIIPPAILVYIVAYMDRTNIGFAIAGGMSKELGLAANFSGLVAGIFFIGYMFLQVPGSVVAERKSAKKFITFSIIAWGLVAVLTGFSQNMAQLLIARFLLGVAEGGVWPAVLTIISHWFPNEERAKANAFFLLNLPIAAMITGPLSGAIIVHFSWRSVFIIEGLLSILLIAVWLPLISNRPEEAKWLDKDEKDYIVSHIQAEQNALGATKKKIPITEMLRNGMVWKLVLLYFAYQFGIYGFSLWLPTILKTLTKSGMGQVGLLSVVPYIFDAAGLLIVSWLSDKMRNRRMFTAVPALGFAACLVLSVTTHGSIWVSFAFLCGCGFFMHSGTSIFWTLPTSLFPSDLAASSRGIINAIGNLGGFLGPYLVGFLTQQYNADIGTYSLAIFLVFGFLLTISLPKKLLDN